MQENAMVLAKAYVSIDFFIGSLIFWMAKNRDILL